MTQEKQDATSLYAAGNQGEMPEEWQKKIKRLNAQREQLKLYTADLDLLMQRFNVEKSWLGRVAGGFASLRWWLKGLIGIVFCGVFALIGLPFGVAWVIALPIIALVLYAGMVLIFENYAKSDRNRFARLSEGLVLREAEMKESVLELQALENEIQALIGQLKDLGQDYTASVASFQEQSELLATQVQSYQAARVQFEQLKASYGQHVQDMKAAEEEFSSDLSDISKKLSEQFSRMKENTDVVEKVTLNLKDKVASLQDEALGLQASSFSANSPFNNLLEEGFYLRTDEEDLEEKRRFAEADVFLEETDAFMRDFSDFLSQQNATLESSTSSVCLKTPSIAVLN